MFGAKRQNPGFLIIAVLSLAFSLFAQIAPEETSPIQLMIDVVASESTDSQLRFKHALALVQDPQAHQALIDLLTQSTDLTTRTIICQALAAQTNGQGDLVKAYLPKIFIEPLVATLFNDNKALYQQAAAALAQCPPDMVHDRLSEVLDDPEQPVLNRRAVIEVMPRLPGKQTILILARLMEDPEPEIRDDAWAAINELMPIPAGYTSQTFLSDILPQLRKMNEAEFMFRQYRHLYNRLTQMKIRVNQSQQQANAWRQEFLNTKTLEFSKITEPAQRLEMVSKAMDKEADPALRIQALAWVNDWLAGGAVPATPVGGPLTKLLSGYISDPNAQARRLCAEALEKIPSFSAETAGTLLDQLKQEPDQFAQVSQLDALGTLRYIPAVDIAIELLQQENPRISTASAKALGDIASAQGDAQTVDIEHIIKAMVDKSSQPGNPAPLRLQLVTALGKITAQSALRSPARAADDTLRQALDDDNADVRTQAVRGLRHLHSAAVMPLLINGHNMLNDPDEAVRYAVLEAVNQYGDRSHLKPLQERLAAEVANEALAREIRNGYNRIFATLTVDDCFKELDILRQSPQPDQLLMDKCAQALLEKINQILQDNPPDDAARMQLLQLALETENTSVMETMTVQMPALAASSSGEEALNRISAKLDTLNQAQIDTLRRAVRFVAALVSPLEKYPSEQLSQQWNKRRSDLALAMTQQLLAALEADDGKIDLVDITLLKQLKNNLAISPEATRQQQRQILEQYRDKLLNKPKPASPEIPSQPASDKPKSESGVSLQVNPAEVKAQPAPEG